MKKKNFIDPVLKFKKFKVIERKPSLYKIIFLPLYMSLTIYDRVPQSVFHGDIFNVSRINKKHTSSNKGNKKSFIQAELIKEELADFG